MKKYCIWFLLASVICIVVMFLLSIIGDFTIGFERIVYHIGVFSIGIVSERIARWILERKDNERT